MLQVVYSYLLLSYLFRLVVAVDLDAEELALVVPVEADLLHARQVLDAHLATRRNLNDGDPGRDLTLLGDPVSQQVVVWRPRELAAEFRQEKVVKQRITAGCALNAGSSLVLVKLKNSSN